MSEITHPTIKGKDASPPRANAPPLNPYHHHLPSLSIMRLQILSYVMQSCIAYDQANTASVLLQSLPRTLSEIAFRAARAMHKRQS